MVKRIAVAALVASLVPAIPFAGFALLEGHPAAWEWAVSAWCISAAYIGVLGIPAFLLLLRSGRASGLSLVVAGFVLGYVPVFAFSGSMAVGLQMGMVCGVLGAVCGWVFWSVWSRGGDADSIAGG